MNEQCPNCGSRISWRKFRKANGRWACIALLFVLPCGGCAHYDYYAEQMTPESGHRRFLETLSRMVGQDISKSQSFYVRPERKINEIRLANGLIRYRFGSEKYCVQVFDVDPKTNKIMSASFEGSTRQCSVPY
jgi:hypothetical protein